MKEHKEAKIRVHRMYIPQGSGWQAGAHAFQPWLGIPPDVFSIDPLDLAQIIRRSPVGDIIEKKGFVDLLRLDEPGYAPAVPQDQSAYANHILELRTYCLVQVSDKVDASSNVEEFRILYSDFKGEQLATSMAVVASLKDAFINRTKVYVHGEISQVEFNFYGGMVLKSELYNALQSVDLIRG